MTDERDFYILHCRKIKANPNCLNDWKEFQECGCVGTFNESKFGVYAGFKSVCLCEKHKQEFDKQLQDSKRKFVVVTPQGYYLKQTNPNIFTRYKDNAWVVDIETASGLKFTNELSNCIILELDD